MLFHLILLVCSLSLPFASAGFSKRGLAMIPGGNPTDITKASQAVSWVYNWNSSPPLDMPNGILFVPMQWGSMGIATFSGVVTAQGATTILGFNEPDLGSQANLDPNDAASLWKQYIFPLKSAGVRLGAPAISSAPSGAGWLTNFLAACTGCGIDFIPIHWYGIGFEDFSSYIEQLHNQFPNYNFWVTEFADVSDDDAGCHIHFPVCAVAQTLELQLSRVSWFRLSIT
jgi:hypothetical protein